MLNLLKADLYRISKDKLFIVSLIICLVLAIVIPLGYFGITMLTNEITIKSFEASGATAEDIQLLRQQCRDQMLPAYTLTKLMTSAASPFGIVLGVFIIILLGKDRETCRNKIIVGKSRGEIYFANLLLTLIVYIGFMVLYTLVTYLSSIMVLSTDFGTDAWHVLAGIGLRLAALAGTALGISFFTTAFHNNALPIVLHIIINYLSMCVAIFMLAFGAASDVLASGGSEGQAAAEQVLSGVKIISGINFPFSLFGMLGDFSAETIISFVLTIFILGTLFLSLGYVIFKHKKLK